MLGFVLKRTELLGVGKQLLRRIASWRVWVVLKRTALLGGVVVSLTAQSWAAGSTASCALAQAPSAPSPPSRRLDHALALALLCAPLPAAAASSPQRYPSSPCQNSVGCWPAPVSAHLLCLQAAPPHTPGPPAERA